MPKFPTIQEPSQDPALNYDMLRSLKDTAELVTGQRTNGGARFARVFNEVIEPGMSNSKFRRSDIQEGDFWVNRLKKTLYFWDATSSFWIQLI